MSNILLFEAHGLTFVNGPISEIDLIIPQQVILLLTDLIEEIKDKKVFITI